MKTILITFTAALFCISCGEEKSKTPAAGSVVYTGDFGGEPIELALTNLDDSMVKGMSSHKGKQSEMSGKRKASDKGFVYVMKELGNSEYDGVFNFELDTSLHLIFGSWQKPDSTSPTAIMYTLRVKSAQ